MDCSICAEKITQKRHLIECPFCENGGVCVECASKYITSTEPGSSKSGERGCMICEKIWDLEYIEYMFGKKVATEYKNIQKRNLLEREKSLLIITQPAAEKAKIINSILKENTFLHTIRSALLNRIHEVETEIGQNTVKIRNTKPKSPEKVHYVLACPSEAAVKEGEEARLCKGFIDSNTWSCSLCGTVVCDKCHVVIPWLNSSNTPGQGPGVVNKEKTSKTWNIKNVHRCKKADILSVKLIMQDTKPCPSCASRVQKLDGCSQMFCTNCYTGFNWETLKIVTGVIHNPHYYELVKNGTINGANRAMGDIPCGGMPDIWRVHTNKINEMTITKLTSYHRLAGEIQEYLTSLSNLKSFTELFTDLRIKYMINDIVSEEDYSSSIYDLDLYVKKCKIEKDCLDTLIAIFAERYRDMPDKADKIMKQRGYKNKNTKRSLLPMAQRRNNLQDYFDNIIIELESSIDMMNGTFINNNMNVIEIPEYRENFPRFPIDNFEGLRQKEIDELVNIYLRDNYSDDSDSDIE